MIDDKEKKPFNLNMHAHRLLLQEPFFAAISRQLEKVSTTAVPTAGVMISEDGHFRLMYNPEFFEKITDKEKLGVLKHEFYHLIFEHVTGRMPVAVDWTQGRKPTPEEHKQLKLWNFATDLAINSHISEELPEAALVPGRDKFKDYTPYLSAEQYYEQLKKEPEGDNNNNDSQQGEQGNGESQQGQDTGSGQGEPQEGDSEASGSPLDAEEFDTHNWSAPDDTAKQMAQNRLKDSIKKAAQEASSGSGWGSVSAGVKQDIIKSIETKVDWRKVLRNFIKTSQRANRSSSIKRINRRFPYLHAGKKTNRQANVAISIDQSGSVSTEMLEAFFGELQKLATIASFTVIPFDTEVDEKLVYEWKKGNTHNCKRVKYGGTCFNAPTEYVNKNNFDGHIVLTDMEAPKPKASKCQRLWMTDTYHAKRPYFSTNEKIIAIEK